MLTLYYSPRTRATRIIALLMAMDRLDAVDVANVHVPRRGGGGGRDTANPHPEGKVPFLVADGEMIRESAAIMLYLTDYFGGPMGRAVSEKGRGSYLSWLIWNGNVVEPVVVGEYGGIADNPAMQATFRGKAEMDAMLVNRLEAGRWLVDDRPSAADILNASLYWWVPDMMPDSAAVKDWVARTGALYDGDALAAYEATASRALGLPEAV